MRKGRGEREGGGERKETGVQYRLRHTTHSYRHTHTWAHRHIPCDIEGTSGRVLDRCTHRTWAGGPREPVCVISLRTSQIAMVA